MTSPAPVPAACRPWRRGEGRLDLRSRAIQHCLLGLVEDDAQSSLRTDSAIPEPMNPAPTMPTVSISRACSTNLSLPLGGGGLTLANVRCSDYRASELHKTCCQPLDPGMAARLALPTRAAEPKHAPCSRPTLRRDGREACNSEPGPSPLLLGPGSLGSSHLAHSVMGVGWRVSARPPRPRRARLRQAAASAIFALPRRAREPGGRVRREDRAPARRRGRRAQRRRLGAAAADRTAAAVRGDRHRVRARSERIVYRITKGSPAARPRGRDGASRRRPAGRASSTTSAWPRRSRGSRCSCVRRSRARSRRRWPRSSATPDRLTPRS